MEDGRAELVGPQTDIYALGKIAYWLFAEKIYSREKHREPPFDLTGSGQDAWRHYLNDYLDKTTAADPKSRLQITAQLVDEFQPVRRAMTEGARYLDVKLAQVCMFCKIGTYEVKLNSLDGSGVTSNRGQTQCCSLSEIRCNLSQSILRREDQPWQAKQRPYRLASGLPTI
jgi:hypothetical protein